MANDWLAVAVVVVSICGLAAVCYRGVYLAGFRKGVERAIKEIEGE